MINLENDISVYNYIFYYLLKNILLLPPKWPQYHTGDIEALLLHAW